MGCQDFKYVLIRKMRSEPDVKIRNKKRTRYFSRKKSKIAEYLFHFRYILSYTPYADIHISEQTGYFEYHAVQREPLYVAVIGTNRAEVVTKLYQELKSSQFSWVFNSLFHTVIDYVINNQMYTKAERRKSIQFVEEYNKENYKITI